MSPYLVDLTGGQLVAGGGGCNEKAKKSGEPERLAGNCWGAGGEIHNTQCTGCSLIPSVHTSDGLL